MDRQLKVAIAAGGTAGHINPALALAEELSARGHKVEFFGQSTRLEATLVPQAGFPLRPIKVAGFDRSQLWTLPTAVALILVAERTVGKIFKREGVPDVAVGFGAYVELPLVRWCARHGVPYVLHEQNSVPGLANKISVRKSSALCLSFPAAAKAFEGRTGAQTRVVTTGNPVRRSVVDARREDGRQLLGISDDETLLLVFGGSLGARHLNQGVTALKDKILSREGVRVVHSTGKDEYDSVVSALALSDEEATRWQVRPYIDDMGHALAAADLVLSRAGASSVAEIAAKAVPSILVPYPFATADHQTTNAHLLVDEGAAELLPDNQIDTPAFEETLLGLLDDAARRDAMRTAAQGLGQDRAAAALADAVEAAARP
ncbi:MAG: undecaprenyldiphospho-muramoylpentapeptide beta-N-acetylglucosaminyltransferase [Atopobiaceae bacterium]|nr:undecaprenyldiphospho-muramoylpentapeptide beta-N-acetylglucosaminyltransferase [Atopobiaceae bacterium]